MDKLAQIFERQAEYLKSLAPIYTKNGFPLHAIPWPLQFNNRHAQEEFRLLAWRFTEEIMEAKEAFECGSPAPEYHEEMADALHFLIELCLATGIGPGLLISGVQGITPTINEEDSLDWVFGVVRRDPIYPIPFFNAIRSLSIAMMNLRQRPWRTDNREGDFSRFALMMQVTFFAFVNTCTRTGMTAEDLYRAYFAKAKINDERTAQQKLDSGNCEHGVPRRFCTGVHQ